MTNVENRLEDRMFTLSVAQVKKLKAFHADKLSGSAMEKTNMSIVLPESVNEKVVVIDILGNHLGYISVKDAWSL